MQFVIKLCLLIFSSIIGAMMLTACGGGGGVVEAPNLATNTSPPAPVPVSATAPATETTPVPVPVPVPTPTPTPTPTPPAAAPKSVTLPIEVLGPAGYIKLVEFDLPENVAVSSVSKLFLQCHRCSWRDGSVASGVARGAKGSVRLNGGAWTPIADANVDVVAADKAYGGLSNALNTVRFSLPVSGVKVGANTLEFKFNVNDGLSNGYRVLDLNLLDSTGKQLLPASALKNDDPGQWQVNGDAAAIAEGKALWTGKVPLAQSPLSSSPIKAACANCHAASGRDLKYFNYSNWSIEARSKFHGLSSQQGQQIAAYIRSLNVPAPAQARPWNPPYQPGPGLDTKPVAEWAAGAGLQAVLASDAEMLPYLFPTGTSASAVRAVVDKTKTLNMREMPISLQLPDWNDWLPHQHPLDLFETQFLTTSTDGNGTSLNQAYLDVRTLLSSTPVSNPTTAARVYKSLNDFANVSSQFHSANLTVLAAIAAGVNANEARSSIARWSAIKQWEVMQEFALDDKAPQVHGTYGEARSWLTLRRNVFELAPHRSAENKNNFDYQSLAVGKYQSTAWYHAQLVINAGNRKGYSLGPVDWNYTPEHIKDLYATAGGPAQPLRWVASHTKMHQQYADGREMGKTALGFRQIHIQRYVPGQSQGALLDTLPQPLRLNVYESLLASTMDVLEAYPPQDWPRGAPDGGNRVEANDYVLTNKAIARNRLDAICHAGETANCWYSAIPYYKEIGVNSATIKRMADWGKAMWPAPANNWDALR